MAEPMYRQIADDLRRQIDSSTLEPGSQLPTELELRETYNASRNTVRDALKSLITRGLVETRPGQGTFVTERIVPFITTLTGDTESGEGETYRTDEDAEVAKPIAPRTTTPRVEIQWAGRDVAAALGIKEGDSVVSRHQQRYIENRPWSLQTSFYPMRLVERGASQLIQATDIAQGVLAYLHDTLGITAAGRHDTIKVRPADEAEMWFFKLPDNGRVAVIEIVRTIYEDQRTPVRYTTTVFPADRNRFVINVGDVPAHPYSGDARFTNSL